MACLAPSFCGRPAILDALPVEPPGETIVVTGQALPDPAAERAYSVETIGHEALRNAPSSQLEEVLEQIAGLQLFRRSDARSGHPTSQGVTLRALGGNASSRALLVLDGVPQTDPFGGWVNWPAYDPAALSEVRVVRGGGSVAYGSGALAGVIEMRTAVEAALRGGLEVGIPEAAEGRVVVGAPVGGGVLTVAGRAALGEGFVPVTEETRGPADRAAPYRTGSVRALWATPLSADVELQASALAFTDKRQRGLEFTGNRTSGIDGSLRLVGSGRWRWSALGYAQARELSSSFASVSPGRAAARRVSLQDEVPSRAYGASVELRPPLGSAVELRVGADTRWMEGESRELYAYVDDGQPTRRRIAGGRALTFGSFVEVTGSMGALTLSAGGRLDHWRVENGSLREWLLATGEPLRFDMHPDRDGFRPTVRAGAVLDLDSGFAMRAAVYLGWRMPTLNELYRPFRVGADATAANPLLDPERLAGAEVGVDYRRENLELWVTYFRNRLQDGIANVTLASGPGVFPGVGFVGAGGEYRQRRNLNAIRVGGVEASVEARRGQWTIRGGASLVDAEVEGDGPAARLDSLRPAQTPELVLTGGVGWERHGKAFSLIVRHSGAQFEDDLNARKLPAATTVDGFAAWALGQTLQLVVRGENLLNEKVIAGIGGDGSIERATPRTLWVGIRFSREGFGTGR